MGTRTALAENGLINNIVTYFRVMWSELCSSCMLVLLLLAYILLSACCVWLALRVNREAVLKKCPHHSLSIAKTPTRPPRGYTRKLGAIRLQANFGEGSWSCSGLQRLFMVSHCPAALWVSQLRPWKHTLRDKTWWQHTLGSPLTVRSSCSLLKPHRGTSRLGISFAIGISHAMVKVVLLGTVQPVWHFKNYSCANFHLWPWCTILWFCSSLGYLVMGAGAEALS